MIDRTIWKRWLDLQEDGSLLRQLIELFLSTSKESVAQILKAHQEQYAKGVAFHAHALKSSALSLGANTLAEICLELEKLGRAEDLTSAVSWISRLQSEHQQVQDELSREAKQLKAMAS